MIIYIIVGVIVVAFIIHLAIDGNSSVGEMVFVSIFLVFLGLFVAYLLVEFLSFIPKVITIAFLIIAGLILLVLKSL